MAELTITSTRFTLELPPQPPEPPTPEKYVNGVRLPVEEPRKNRSKTTGNIAAIDFGTSSCSVAYWIKGDESGVRLLRLSADDVRVPTAILMDSDGKVKEFGKNARRKYAQLSKEKKKHHYFFNDIKMILQHDKDVSWTTTIKLPSQKEFFIVEVIAMILKYLKDRLLSLGEVSRGITGALEASDFTWVITVPAMWKARGKQMMREAAYLAGIASEDDEIEKLTAVTREGGHFTSIPAKPVAAYTKQDELSLALEPEAAALHCINQCKELKLPCANSSCYMVLDIGGGTVDITAHKVTNGSIQVILPPKGNDWGGKRVNQKFKQFLGDLIDDPYFEKFVRCSKNPEVIAKNAADLDLIVYQLFEDQKQFFGEKGVCDDEALINLPYSFMMTYKDDLERGVERLKSPHIQVSDNELSISYQKMEEFFSEAITEIIACVSECVREVERKHTLDSVFFVGGFGGSTYLHEKVKETLDSRINTYCPRDHKTAIVSGAVLFRQNTAIIKSRVADATYGTDCSSSFDPLLHSPEYKFYDDDRTEKCNYLFHPFVFKGDVIHADKVLTTTYVPTEHRQRSMHFTIFTTLEKSMKYTRTPKGKIFPEFSKIGELTVQMPDMTNDKQRQVRLTFDFSHTEIHIEAYDITSGERVTTTVDFLSDVRLD